jgi:hypothetical protein
MIGQKRRFFTTLVQAYDYNRVQPTRMYVFNDTNTAMAIALKETLQILEKIEGTSMDGSCDCK